MDFWREFKRGLGVSRCVSGWISTMSPGGIAGVISAHASKWIPKSIFKGFLEGGSGSVPRCVLEGIRGKFL